MSARTTASKKRPASQSTKKSAAARAPKSKSGTAGRGDARKPRKAGDCEVTIDRRRNAGRRAADSDSGEDASSTVAPPLERRQKVNRRRQIDPTTCERDYSEAEVEFMNALDDYKRKSGRMFPTCSEVLEVVRALGYVKLPAQEMGADEATQNPMMPMPVAGDNLQTTARQMLESAPIDESRLS